MTLILNRELKYVLKLVKLALKASLRYNYRLLYDTRSVKVQDDLH